MIDKYVVFYTGHCGWSAVSLNTGLTGYGFDPREAVNNVIKMTDELVERGHNGRATDRHGPATELISRLAKIAQPLDCNDYNQGVVYLYQRTCEGEELPDAPEKPVEKLDLAPDEPH